MAKATISRSRKMVYSAITIVLLLVIAELCCRAYYYQTLSSLHPSGLYQLAKDLKHQITHHRDEASLIPHLQHNQALVRPQLSREVNNEIEAECRAANKAVFEPWVEFAFTDVRSHYVNVIDHRRVSIPDRSDPNAKDPLCIYFIGGSTTYGYNVTDEETIPSAFVRAYRQRYPGGRPIRVVNLGMPFYYSYQELILLSDRLFRDEHPDMVVMLDGVNDCFEATASMIRSPVLTPRMRDRITPGDVDNASNQLTNLYTFPAGMSLDSGCTLVVNRYLANIRHAHDLGGLYHIPVYCFWQPMPYYNYPNRLHDPICAQGDQPRFGIICPRVRDSAVTIPYLHFLGDMLHDEKGLPFVDQLHYSPYFNGVMAEKMLDFIRF